MTVHARSSPAASALTLPPPSSRLRFANDSVTAVDETSPPVRPVTAVPRLGPSMRVAT